MSRTDLNQNSSSPAFTRFVRKVNVEKADIPSAVPPEIDRTDLSVARNNFSRLRVSVVTPGYSQLRKKGLLPTNAFTYSEWNQYPCEGIQIFTEGKTGGFNIYQLIETTTGVINASQICDAREAAPSAFLVSNVSSQSSQACLLKIKDMDVNLGEVYGERHETLNMIRTNADRIGKAYAALRKGNFGGAAKALGLQPRSSAAAGSWAKNQSKAIANGWLELQYGWRPLIQDVYGGAEFLRKSFTLEKTGLMRASATRKLSDSNVAEYDINSPVGAKLTQTKSYSVDVKTCVYYRRNSSTLSTLNSLGITNPAYLAWELTKFSFVVDWFVHVGDFISSLDATFGYTFQDGCVTTFSKLSSTRDIFGDGPTYNGSRDRLFIQTHESSDLTECVRRPLLTFPILSLPAFKDPRSVEHALNAIALLRQARR